MMMGLLMFLYHNEDLQLNFMLMVNLRLDVQSAQSTLYGISDGMLDLDTTDGGKSIY